VAPFDVTSRREDGRLRVICVGELDIATAADVRTKLAGREPGEDLILDLRGLDFLDTSGIQLVVETFRSARDENFTLTVLKAPARVHRVFEIAGLDEVLPFEDGDG
jgi:anti-anti-sigma factor